MAGSIAGGLKCAKANKERYGEDWYREIGRKGGSRKTNKPKGFAANPELARIAGAAGGRKSKRGKHVSDEYIEARKKMNDYKHRIKKARERLMLLETDYEINEVEEQLEHYEEQLEKYQKLLETL